MVKPRRRLSQRAIEQELAGGRSEQDFASNNLSDSHGCVIHHHRQLVGRHIVVTPYDEITKIFSGYKLLRTATAIGEADDFAVGHLEAPVGLEGRGTRVEGQAKDILPRPSTLDPRLWPARAGINRFIVGYDVLPRTGAGVNTASSAEPFKCGHIEFPALALGVWPPIPAAVWAFVPVQPGPAQVFEHGGNKLGPAPGCIQVFIPQHQRAVLRAGAFLRGPKGAGMAPVEEAGGRRREAAAVVGHRNIKLSHVLRCQREAAAEFLAVVRIVELGRVKVVGQHAAVFGWSIHDSVKGRFGLVECFWMDVGEVRLMREDGRGMVGGNEEGRALVARMHANAGEHRFQRLVDRGSKEITARFHAAEGIDGEHSARAQHPADRRESFPR